jgi:hypothetical protein
MDTKSLSFGDKSIRVFGDKSMNVCATAACLFFAQSLVARGKHLAVRFIGHVRGFIPLNCTTEFFFWLCRCGDQYEKIGWFMKRLEHIRA